jgi:hypothetical protein
MTNGRDDTVLPVLGNLAWAPRNDFDRISVLDRFNGIPTLGAFSCQGRVHLFWKAVGYVTDPKDPTWSVWLYVPLPRSVSLDDVEDVAEEILTGVLFGAGRPEYAAVGLAQDSRLIFEREWMLPDAPDIEALIAPLLRHVSEALHIMVEQGLPPHRAEALSRAGDGLRELTCH